MTDLTVIILTKNEKDNLPKAINSVKKIAKEIIIVDSGSTDETLEIAEKLGCRTYYHQWETYSKQYNWAFDNLKINTEWIMRLDADEEITEELSNEIDEKLPKIEKGINGIILRRRLYFLGRWIKHGGIYPQLILRIFRKGKGRLEDKIMDEHIVLSEGSTICFKNDFIDNNIKDLSWWISKYNWYSDREVYEVLNLEKLKNEGKLIQPKLFGKYYERKRWLKEKIYLKFSPSVRAYLYYLYRFYFKLGFLDGREGKIYHFLQAYWYRFLIDAKLYEVSHDESKMEELEKKVFKSLD